MMFQRHQEHHREGLRADQKCHHLRSIQLDKHGLPLRGKVVAALAASGMQLS